MQITQNNYGPVAVYTARIEAPESAPRGADRILRERRAVQQLVEHAFGAGVALEHRADGSPWLPHSPQTYISVSHSRRLAVLAVSPVPVGVDVEEPRATLLRIGARFLTQDEQKLYHTLSGLLKAWTLKEAAFKALRPAAPATTMPLPPAPCPYTIIYSGPHPEEELTHMSIVVGPVI